MSRLRPSAPRRWRFVLPTIALVAAALPAALPAALRAQGASAVDPRFQPWLGCWGASSSTAGGGGAGGPTAPAERACVVPSATVAGSVDLALLRGDSLEQRTPLPRPGIAAPRTVDGCTGEELASWSVDNRHLLLRSTLTCAGGIGRTETAVMGFTDAGDWLQVQHIDVGGNAATTVSKRAPLELTDRQWQALGGGAPRSSYAMRLALGAPLALSQVREMATRMPAPLTEAWLVARAPRFGLNGRALLALQRDGVPARVIDMLVALDNPAVFAVGPDSLRAADEVQLIGRGGCRSRSECGWARDPWGPVPMGAWGASWGWDPWAWRYGNVGYGYGFGYAPWNSPWGYGFGTGYYWGNQPLVIVPRGTPSEAGRAVPGQGYVRERRATSTNDAPGIRTVGGGTTGSTGRSGGSSSGGSSGGSSSGSSGGSSGGSSTGRTAKPRGGS